MQENKYLVYHYCDLYAFLNIMRTKTLYSKGKAASYGLYREK